ncbi:MAG: CT253 family lipoprotein [Rhabdochlamydiaceae bacterium]|jgi:hypothetical protein
MSRFILSISLLALIVGGCNDDQQACTQSQGAQKPVVSIVPIIDNTKNDYEWNLSDELSCSIYTRIAQKDHVTVNKASTVRHKIKQIAEGQNPFGPDVSWMKKVFQGDQFAVFLELVEHEEVFNQDLKKRSEPQYCSSDLNMTMRVRVLDLRGDEPKIVLQELIHDSHYIPRPFTQANFFQVTWGDECFNISPLGLAHSDFTKEIASRIDDYISMAAKQ